MKIIVPVVPLSKNQYVNQHWSWREKYKSEIGWIIHGCKYNHNYPKLEKANITFDIYFKTKRRRDVQNYLGGGLIAWLDVLSSKGFIKDDCYEVIGQPVVNFHIDKDNPRTEIIIETIG